MRVSHRSTGPSALSLRPFAAVFFCIIVASPWCSAAGTYRMTETGAILDPSGELFIPLGGFYGNWVPLQTSPVLDEYRLSNYVTESEWRPWFSLLQANGVNIIRIFCRVQMGDDILSTDEAQMDIAGHVHPDVWAFWQQYMNVGAEYGMRYHFIILSEPHICTYVNPDTSNNYALPIYQREGWEQNRFVNEDPAQLDQITRSEYFTDPEARALLWAYLEELLPQLDTDRIAILEVINEQGWNHDNWTFRWDSQEQEIAFTEDVIQFVKNYYPEIPVCFSHAGHGMVGMDPLHWLDSIPSADFYSFHFYPCISGETEYVDYGVIPQLIARYIGGNRAIHCGEAAMLLNVVPEPERSLTLRDGLWTTMANGASGYYEWQWYVMPTGVLAEFASARQILETYRVPLWHRKKSRWALDITAASIILGASEHFNSKRTSPPWTTMARWDAYFRDWAAAYDMVREPTGYERIFDPVAEPPAEPPPDRPVWVTGPYQGITFMAEEGTLIYLRNGGGNPMNNCYYRQKNPGSLELTLSPRENDRRVVIYDLDDVPGNPTRVFNEVVPSGQSITSFANTDHDYVLVLRPTMTAGSLHTY